MKVKAWLLKLDDQKLYNLSYSLGHPFWRPELPSEKSSYPEATNEEAQDTWKDSDWQLGLPPDLRVKITHDN